VKRNNIRNHLADFCREVGLPTTLAELGVLTDEQIHVIAENACVEGETIHNLAGDVTPDELYAAIVATNALGWKGEK
jgi:glycerol dehydrogenase